MERGSPCHSRFMVATVIQRSVETFPSSVSFSKFQDFTASSTKCTFKVGCDPLRGKIEAEALMKLLKMSLMWRINFSLRNVLGSFLSLQKFEIFLAL